MNYMRGELTRRALIRSAAGVGAVTALGAAGILPIATASAAEDDTDKYDFLIARVRFKLTQNVVDVWNTGPGAERNLLEELTKYVRCKVKLPQGCYCNDPYYGEDRHFNAVVDFSGPVSPQKYPFLLMTSEGYFSFNSTQKTNLKNYVDGGGFIFMDDCVAGMGTDFFYQSAHNMVNEVYGSGALTVIPKTHEVFNNVFDLSKTGLPNVSGVYHPAEGLWRGDRIGIILSSTDIHCGWIDKHHNWYTAARGKTAGYEDAIQFGINMIVYVLAH